jgi:2-polyprenyl-3-methyl-5-hydroxy-6-metoxy-1,4-benzoquinol methylase
MEMEMVKQHYIETERYDWVIEPKHLSKMYHGRRAKETVKVIKRHFAGESILDVGCGTGLITRHLAAERVVGLDINPWAIERARGHCPDAEFVTGDAENLGFETSSFDMVVCTQALEHLPRPGDAVKEAHRVLRNGGFYIGSVPSKSLVWKLRGFLSSRKGPEEPFHNSFSIKELKMLLSDFEKVEISSRVFGLIWLFVAQKY